MVCAQVVQCRLRFPAGARHASGYRCRRSGMACQAWREWRACIRRLTLSSSDRCLLTAIRPHVQIPTLARWRTAASTRRRPRLYIPYEPPFICPNLGNLHRRQFAGGVLDDQPLAIERDGNPRRRKCRYSWTAALKLIVPALRFCRV